MSWTPARLADQHGKTFVITGANSGIGLEAARLLSARGAHVVLACRSRDKANDAMAELHRTCSAARLSFVRLDLASLASVADAAATITENHPRLDGLVNNAGVMALPRRETVDGFEMQLGTNHLGHFALTLRLLAAIEAAAGRVVSVSSSLHSVGRIDFDDPMGRRRYGKWSAYAQSKLANLLFTLELQRRLRADAMHTRAVACHPGYASTNLQQVGARMSGSAITSGVMRLGGALFAQSAAQGAWPTVLAATDPEAQGGEFYGPVRMGGLRGPAGRAIATSRARDLEAAQRLWALSESLTDLAWSRIQAA